MSKAKVNYEPRKTQAEIYLEKLVEQANERIEEANTIIQSYKDAEANQDQLSKLKAWALDRALNLMQITKAETATPQSVMEVAEQFALYTYGKDYKELKDKVNAN